MSVAVQASEREWLDLLADVTTRPPLAMPSVRIAQLLCETFGGMACSYARLVDKAVVGGLVRSDGRQISTRAWAASGQAEAVCALAVDVWNDAYSVRCSDRMSLPASMVSSVELAFVVGRNAPFRLADRRLSATLWTLLAALNARIRTEAMAEPEPLSATSVALTGRQMVVLALLGEGLTAAAIARRLRISVRTVHKHLERIYAKLDVTDRLAAVLAARRLGVVPSGLVETEPCWSS